MADLKQTLQDIIREKRLKKEEEETRQRRKIEEDRVRILSSVGQDLAQTLLPAIRQMPANIKLDAAEMREVISNAVANAMAEKMPNSPTPNITVNVPPIKIPESKAQSINFPESMRTELADVDRNRPLPVMLMDFGGKPFQFPMSGGGGGKADFLTIKGYGQSAFSEITNPDGRLKVELPSGSSGLTDTELRASAVPVSQVSGAAWSTEVKNTVEVLQLSGSINSVNVVTTVGLTNTELRAAVVPVEQLSGSQWSTSATQAGTWNIGTVTTVTGVTNSIASALVDSSGIQYSGSNPLTVSVSGAVASTGAYLLNGDGTYRDTMPISGAVTLSGSLTSTVATGPTAVDAADDGTAPVQTGGIARTANPTAVAGGDVVKSTHDDLGRQVTRPIQVRDLVKTAYATVTNVTETTLLAGTASAYNDLIFVKFSNQSTAAVNVAIRSSTAGTIVDTFSIGANATVGYAPKVPIPANELASAWTFQNTASDDSTTTITASGLFTTEI